MRVVLSWLREFVPVEAEPDALAERLTLAGFAVEEIIRTGEGVSGVVVGEVRAIREHPDADNLILVKAFDGRSERDIVCGARNFAVGDRVPVAVPGARLPGDVEIGQRSVRGETSDGMLCSARELRISEDHSGILVLDPDAPLGADLVRALALEDVVLHLDVTTNRGDALSVVGIAREVAAIYGLPLTIPEPVLPEGTSDAGALASVRIDDARGCPRYLARVIEGVSVGPSPWRIRRRLLAAGMRPVSNVVDVTNYVLLERGHPLHAFDLDRLAGSAIVVRRPRRSETIRTLDGIERALERDDVVICDAERPVAVAGVMGGADSEVSEKTSRLLLESAYFDPLRIRRTAGRLKLRTEASVRFERGADPGVVPAAAARAVELLASLAGGSVARGAIDAYPKPIRRRPIRLRVARAAALLGVGIPAATMELHLRALGCSVETSRSVLRVTPPSWRPDVAIEEDLIEEVARIQGYDTIPETLPTGARSGGLTRAQKLRARARDALLGAGLNEAQTQSLISPGAAERLGLPADHALFAGPRVSNPVSEDESILRPSLVPGLLAAAQRNTARRVLPVSLFEIGTTFHTSDRGLHEHLDVAWVLAGPAPEGWHRPGRDLDLFDAKGVVESLLAALGVRDLAFRQAAIRAGAPLLHPGRSAKVLVGDDTVGLVAELTPRAAAVLELPSRVVICTLQLGGLIERAGGPVVSPPSRYPAVARDVALVVPDSVPAAEVEAAVRAAGGQHLEAVALFDVYRGDPVAAGHTSLAFALSFRDPERTLTDADVDAALQRIHSAAREAGWSVRE